MRELSLNVLDLVQNSIAAKADLVEIDINEESSGQVLDVTVKDNGIGMTREQASQAQDPFYTTRTTRPVGLGIPLFRMACEMTGGNFSINSVPEKGTVVRGEFRVGHIDMTPVGDMNATILLLVTCNPGVDFVYTRKTSAGSFVLDTRELRRERGGEMPPDAEYLREYLARLAPA